MDDTCAVCADDLEWVAYGSCGHREVCSTCVVRMRFVLGDRRCCLCKIESPTVFVTKAMGDYTRVITDFSQFPEGVSEGQVGNYWYHEDTQAYFDDVDQYRMVKAMCRLSCSVCDNSGEDAEGGGGKRRSRFKNIEQLKNHLHHRHRLYMCTLCLEGRKVFICEQKLYTRAQLNKHVTSGDPEVDGSEKERGGFMGHPMCEFCRAPFYGDNELYMHMSTEHFKCHICQRQHPGQYDYFRNYDDLEIHFRQEHFLCENEECLAKKFIVFPSESELKRHNAIEHGGNMSRSKRNAALQIPTSFRYRRSENEQRRGRGRGFRNDSSDNQSSDNQLAMAIQASLEMANSRGHGSTNALTESEHRQTNQVDIMTGQLESLAVTSDSSQVSRSPLRASQRSRDIPVIEESSFPPLSNVEPTETSSRYAQALIQGSGSSTRLAEESFPPLPGSSEVSQPKPSQTGNKSIAAHLRQQSKLALKSAQAKAAKSVAHPQSFTSASSQQQWPTPNREFVSSASTNSSHSKVASSKGVAFSGGSGFQARATKENEIVLPNPLQWPTPNQKLEPSSSRSSSQPRMSASNGVPFAGTSSLQVTVTRENEYDSAWSVSSKGRLNHSSSAPNLVGGETSSHRGSVPPSNMDNRVQSSEESLQKEDVHIANKSLVDRIRNGLRMDEDKFSAFKNISAEYRQGLIATYEYLSYVEQFGLIDLVPELARLCPDAQKQKELIDAYNATLQSMSSLQGMGISSKKQTKGKEKGKSAGMLEESSSKHADNILDEVRRLQASYKPQEEMEVLTKDGYRALKGKSTTGFNEEQPNLSAAAVKFDTSAMADPNSAAANGKQRPKKTSKFHRVRLGDGSMASILDLNRSNASPERPDPIDAGNVLTEGLPARGVWRNGGGQKLFATTRHTPI